MSQARPVDEAGVPTDSDRAQESSGIGEAPTLRASSPSRLEPPPPGHLLPVVDSIRLFWPDDLPMEPEALRAWLMSFTSDEPPASSWH